MRKILIIAFIFLRITALGQADYQSNVCTPKGDVIVAWSTAESDTSTRAYYDSYFASTYPNAQQIKTYDNYSSTRKYNCHGYAWHVSDGGADRWIGYSAGNTDEFDYWLKGSYVEVGYAHYPGKVSWASGDHSAVTTATSGWFISKWNEYPLMFHRWDDSPYGSSNLKYYKLNFSITGTSLLCTTNQTYTLTNTPGGFITWGKSASLGFNGSNTGQSVSIIPSSNGSGFVTVNFTSGCGTSFSIPQKDVWVGPPVISGISGPTSTPNNQWATYTAQLQSDLSAPTAYNWILNPVNGNSVYNYGSTCDIAFYNAGTYQLVVQAKNVCSGSGYGPYYVTGLFVYNPYRLAVSPNPSTAETTLSLVSDTNEAVQLTTDWDLDVYDSFQGLKEKKTKLKTNETKINTSGWKEGVYIIRATIGDKVLTEKMLVKH